MATTAAAALKKAARSAEHTAYVAIILH